MGYVCGEYLKPAGAYVLKLLKENGSLRYNENFYFDGKEEPLERVRVAMGFTDEDPEDTSYPPILVDWAVGQMERKGLVVTEHLPVTMADGEPDYTITLTEKGKEFLASGREFKHWDMDL